METGSMERDYDNAEKAWAKYDHSITNWYLERILNTAIPEPTLLWAAGLALLPAVLRQRWHRKETDENSIF